MLKNIGNFDKTIRIFAALMVGALFILSGLSGTLAIALGAVAAVLVMTAFVGTCPLYLPFKFSTIRRSTKGEGTPA